MRIREPVVAGQFYPAEPARLESDVTGYMGDSGVDPDPEAIGIVSPHAGYVYSGKTAGAAFASAPSGVRRVIIIAPSHRYPFPGASVFSGEEYRTPLGSIRLDRELITALLDTGLSYQPAAHYSEHSAEVQVPFVQVRHPDAAVCVIIQGGQSGRASGELGQTIASALPPVPGETLMVASSDMSHYHSIERAREMDGKLIEAFESLDSDRLESLLSTREAEACGGGPIMTLLAWGRARRERGLRADVVAYDTSASASGDERQVVGYFAGRVSLMGAGADGRG